MRRASLASVVVLGVGVVAAGVALHAAGRKDVKRPAGSEAAFKAFERVLPSAKVLAVEAPTGFGLESASGKPLFWTFRYQLDGKTSEVPITPSGLIVRLKRSISPTELPPSVAGGLATEASGAKVLSYAREEIWATLKLVPLPKPKLYYVVNVAQTGIDQRMVVQADGKVTSITAVTASAEGDEKDEGAATTTAKEIEIPKAQALAVKAAKAAYPGAVVTAVEAVGYDDGSGDLGVLYYEVEFPWHGKVKEAHATPDGYLLDQDRIVKPTDLPGAVRRAVEAKYPKASIRKATVMEDHAGAEFVSLQSPKRVYMFGIEKEGRKSTLRLTAGGKKINPVQLGG